MPHLLGKKLPSSRVNPSPDTFKVIPDGHDQKYQNLHYPVCGVLAESSAMRATLTESEFSKFVKRKDVSIPFDAPESNLEEILRQVTWLPSEQLPVPKLVISVLYVSHFTSLTSIVSQLAEGRPLEPRETMRYELLRTCTFRTYPKGRKPFLTRFAKAGFYYASDDDGVVCYVCGIRRYGWTESDDPETVHRRINMHCKFFKKNEEYNVPATVEGPLRENLSRLEQIPDCSFTEISEDVDNQETRLPGNAVLIFRVQNK